MGILALLLLLSSVSRAQQKDLESALNDEQRWTLQIFKTVPPAELKEAARQSAEKADTAPLLDLAKKYKLVPPPWLKQRVEEQGEKPTLASLGDSITAGTGSCPTYVACPSNSWSTGNSPASVLRGLGPDWNPFLAAIPGATMGWIPAEAFSVFLASEFGLRVARITLLVGHNDPGVCGPDQDGALSDFTEKYSTALSILNWPASKRGAKLFASGIVEVPALARYESLTPLGSDKTCRQLWDARGLCSNVLQHAQDAAWLAKVSARIDDYDGTLRRLSEPKTWARYTPTLNSISRQGLPDPERNISPFDCFHPSEPGQELLGRLAWSGQGGLPGIKDFFAPSSLRASTQDTLDKTR